MSESETLKEFLIQLGVKIDEPAFKKFDSFVQSSSKAIVGLAAAMTTTAVAVAAGVTRFAAQMETLYFAAQRTGSSATNLKAFDMAARNFGATATEAQASAEGLARALRMSPGNENLLKMFGVDTRDANGDLRATTDMLVDMSRSARFKLFSKEQMFTLERITQMLGISENTMLAMGNSGFAEEFSRLQESLGKLNLDKAAAEANRFDIRLQDLKIRAEALLVPLGEKLMEALGPKMEQAVTWFDQNGDKITKTIAAIGDAVVPVATAISNVAEIIFKTFEGIYKLGHAIGEVINLAIPDWMKDGIGGGTAWLFDKLGIADQVNSLIELGGGADVDPNKPGPLQSAAGITRGIRNNNPGNLEFAGQAGARKEPGVGGRFAVFGTSDEGLQALARQIELYGERGYNSVRAIISKFAPPNENDTASYIEDISKKLGVSSTAGLNLHSDSTLANMMNAIIMHENMNRNPYRSDQLLSAAHKGIAQTTTVNISPNVTITVAGGRDPDATARAVGAEQTRVTERITRSALAQVR